MKGFDRPLKPEWIYKMVQVLEIGDKIYDYRDKLDDILVELDGKTGKRKVITVVGRYFLKTFENPLGKKVEDNLIFNIIKNTTYEKAKPLMLFNLLVKSRLLQHFSAQLHSYYGGKEKIESDFLRKKAYQKIGERDIARRSLRNFLSTLVDFDILKQEERTSFSWNKKMKIGEESLINLLRLYSEYYLNSPQISLYDLPESIFFYYEMPDLQKAAQKYNNIYWHYTRRVNAAIITII